MNDDNDREPTEARIQGEFVSKGALPQLETIATDPLKLPSSDNVFDKLRIQAQELFDARDTEQWLEDQLEPHAVELGEMRVAPKVTRMVEEEAARDDEKLIERAMQLGGKIEEARDAITRYRAYGKSSEFDVQWRLREEEVAARERVVLEHQAKEAELLQRLRGNRGDLQRVPNDPFSWTVEWSNAPQEFTINVTSIRGMRGKVRDGYYVFLFSVVDRVGGQIVRFSSGERNKDCSAAIPPVKVKSKSGIVDRFVNSSVDLMCPGPSQLGTHAVLMVELWQLRVGKYDPTDKVVAFGYWPLVNQQFRVVEGKFKVPLILGDADDSVDTFTQMGALVEDGLQYWLGNLYFEIKSLRRQRERVEADQQQQDALGPAAIDIDGVKLRLERQADDIRSLTFPALPPRLFFDDVKLAGNADQATEVKTKHHDDGDLRDINSSLWEKRALLETEKIQARQELAKRKTRAVTVDEDNDLEIAENKMRNELTGKGATRFQRPGIVTSEGDVAGKMRDSHVLLGQHHFALASQREFFFMGRRWRDLSRIGWSVVKYDIGVNHGGPWDKPRAVINIVFFAIGMYARMIVHSVAKHLYLSALDVPLTTEKWNFWHIDLRFSFTSRFYPMDTVGCMSVGFACTIGIFMIFSFSIFLLLMIFNKIPYFMTRFMFWFGIAVILDPVVTAIAEAAAGNLSSGEPFLLYNQFQREEGTGVHGALLTVALYMGMELPHLAVFFLYVIFVHLNGRAFDVYRRLTYPETSFFLPHDLEMGATELSDIVKRAKAFRSDQGEIKRVTVDEFNHKYICLFRERLFKLLSIMSNNPDEWIGEYFDKIAVRRPVNAKSLVKHNMGTFKVGSDSLQYMKRNFPHLCSFSRHRVGDIAEDLYYEGELIRGVSMNSTVNEDEVEMREFLKAYFRSQISGEKPVEWSQEDHDVFVLKDKQLLADLIFFETSGSTTRAFLLVLHLRKFVDDYLFINPEDPESWREVHMPDFDRDEPIKSIEGDDAKGVVTHITLENPARGSKTLLRAFVITPFGTIIEPTASSFTYQITHTADHPEFWAAKAVQLGRRLDEENRANNVGLL